MQTATLRYFLCEKGHGIESPVPMTECPAFIHGKPCDAAIHRVKADGTKWGSKREDPKP